MNATTHRTGIERRVGVVVIGRNEGERLRRCLASMANVPTLVYVDSASTDGSVTTARDAGVETIVLSAERKMTAARGRNAGLAWLNARHPEVAFVQFVDGDCEMQPDWIRTGADTLEGDPELAIVFGRCRERFPDRSIYNALCDDEWNTPIGEALTCGGNSLCRIEALNAVGGFDETMIAGEEPDMATRLRARGWRLRRIGDEMVLHDAAILTFSQWWTRARRGGHAVAELAFRHPGLERPAWRRRCRSILFWGMALPLVVIILLIVAALIDTRLIVLPLLLLLAWPLQMARLALRRRRDLPPRVAAASGIFTIVGKFAELLGLLRFERRRLSGTDSSLIEYKGATGTAGASR